MDIERTPLDLDTPEAARKHENKLDMADDAKLDIGIELIVNGQPLLRKFRAEDVSHIDWNPIINDMADTIARSKE